MDREVEDNLEAPSAPPQSPKRENSSSQPELFPQIQAALKRQRFIGAMQKYNLKPRRNIGVQQKALRNTGLDADPLSDTQNSPDAVSEILSTHTKNTAAVAVESQEVASITAPTMSGTTFDESFNQFNMQREEPKIRINHNKNSPPIVSLSQSIDCQRKVLAPSQETNEGMNTVLENLSSHMSSVTSAVINNEQTHLPRQKEDFGVSSKHDGGDSTALAKKTACVQDQVHHFRNFLSRPVTQSSMAGTSCATTTSVHSTSAPMLNATTYISHPHQEASSHVVPKPVGHLQVHHQLVNQVDRMPLSHSPKATTVMQIDQTTTAPQTATSAIDTQVEVKESDKSKHPQGANAIEVQRNSSVCYDISIKGKESAKDLNHVPSQTLLPNSLPPNLQSAPPKPEKQEKIANSKGAGPRKRTHDPEQFFKVNGKHYQRLGKIGSGGSSEVHKVISSDCTIYALKKIKLKGRDYATAYGFCQEIVYLNKLKRKTNIIQLIDFEVTDKTLLSEVMSGLMSNKDRRVKDDGFIYMVLEYGEIDLAHMLSQKWQELDGSYQTIDENWLRFYWQQILQAVNTIHEERIVHSDLKPANFLLVKGSLKLIDFGIAKAILSDTTNIERDSQVGTLSYMSPEAFMCNESDADGNVIKCGRPSDIWSLGCILYQMVYGRTPFAEYKTFWAKFKVITDPNHEITYEPVSNPWLLDLMRKCLAWDRNERWRIPQLLEHPFLVPPIPTQLSASTQDQGCKVLQFMAEACGHDREASMLCSQINQLVNDPFSLATSESLASRDQQHKWLSMMSKLCLQLQESLAKSEGE